ncbi:hypothetical protein CsSME_00001600 [Camellia sinensis var. sinensis]
MAEGENKDPSINEDYGQHHVVTLNDSPSLQISPMKLDGTNYLIWPCSCSLAIAARRFTGYITSDLPQPAYDDPLHTQWVSENSLVDLAN